MLRRGDGRCKDDASARAWLGQEATGRGRTAGAQAACTVALQRADGGREEEELLLTVAVGRSLKKEEIG